MYNIIKVAYHWTYLVLLRKYKNWRDPLKNWTFESQPDIQSMHGIDVEQEIIQALSEDIVKEIRVPSKLIVEAEAFSWLGAPDQDFIDHIQVTKND